MLASARGLAFCWPLLSHPPSLHLPHRRHILTAPSCRSELFRYYHERLPGAYPFPAQPAWKAGDSPEHEEEEEEGGAGEEDPHAHKQHDDVIGEQVGRQLWRTQGSSWLAAGR